MERIELVKGGKQHNVHPKLATTLVDRGLARYLTRDIKSAPVQSVARPMDEYDSMEADALRALAQERGISVHHRAGPDRIREALRS